MKKRLLFFLFVLLVQGKISYSQGHLSGSLEANTNFYVRDTAIGALGIPQYDNLLSGTDAWLALNYFNYDWGFNAGVRFDLYNNSQLFDPAKAFTGVGIGRFYFEKKIFDLTILGGYFYDQFGSGITFRAYEERSLGIDNAILGVRLKYDISDNWYVKGFTGKQKNVFSTFEPIIKGANLEGFHSLGEGLSIAPGVSAVNRTLDQASMDIIVSNIEGFPVEERFIPKYNVYAFSAYNRLNIKDFSWYLEVAGKTEEAINDRQGELINEPGSVVYSTLTYTKSKEGRGFGITGSVKRTENFVLRTSPNETLLKGQINFLPPMARQNTYQLLARYNAATQELGELAYKVDIITTPVKGISFTFNHSNIYDLDRNLLFREFYGDVSYRKNPKYKLTAGAQVLKYNQVVYENEGVPMLTAVTPFTEFTYKLTRRKSLVAQLQYMHNDFDYGSWIFGLLEFNIAPKWSFAVSDMYNIDPHETDEAIHYYSIFGSFTHRANRFALSYVKQVEGIVCTGGVCRYEPAFSGLKFTVNSTF